MRYNRNVLFTTNYGVQYDNWQKLDVPNEGQFRDVYLWCNYYVYTWVPNYYLEVIITDIDGKVYFNGTIETIDKYNKIKKQLKFTTCTNKDLVYFVDENNTYLTDDLNSYFIE